MTTLSSQVAQSKAWTRLRDCAREEGTKPSNITSQPLTASDLLGSYTSVYDSHTGLEAMDDLTDLIICLHITVDPPQRHASDETVADDEKGNQVDSSKRSQSSFADIRGRFEWWNMIGTFKGLYRPDDAQDNLWLFGGLNWEPPSDKYRSQSLREDAKFRNKEDFGLAAIVTLDDSGRPFLEMLYNATLFYTKDHEPDGKPISKEAEYVRVLWKKQEIDGEENWLDISHKEAKRLWRDDALDLSEFRDFSDDGNEDKGTDNQEKAIVGTKRTASEEAEEAGKVSKKVKT